MQFLLHALLVLPALLAGIALFGLFGVYAERKVSAYIQDREGPLETGPLGLLQTAADIVKLLLKETIVPTAADRLLFLLAPLLVFASVFAGFAVIPLLPGLSGAYLNLGALFLLAVISMEVIGLLLAGWGSNNKYSLFGAIRSVSQIVSYEAPAGLALLAGLMMYGGFDLHSIVAQQGSLAGQPLRLLGIWEVQAYGGVLTWGVVRYPHLLLAFVIFFIASLAESNRAPFDLPEAESELIGGFNTEYSGFGFALLMLAEYAAMFLLSLLAVTVFWGGWNTPLPNLMQLPESLRAGEIGVAQQFRYLQFASLTTGPVWGVLWLLLKALCLIFVMFWVRWTYPRLRPDQLLRLCWKYLTPFALLCVVLSAILKVSEMSFALG